MNIRSIPLRLTAACAVAALMIHVGPAQAGEVDDLKNQLRALMQKVKQLEARQNRQEEKIGQQSTAAKVVTSGKEDVSLEISGQVNRLALIADDGDESRIFQADNDNSSTRVRWVGKARLNDEYSAGALIEVQFESNSTANIDIDQEAAGGTNSFTERHLTTWFNSETFGKLWLGQGDTASNGTSEVDLSGASVIAYSGIADVAGGLSFKNAVTGAKLTRIGQAYSNLDGRSRDDRIRYDTPTFAGFKASASFVDGDAGDVALRYSANYEQIGIKVAAAIAYADGGDRYSNDQINGSISALHQSGFNLTFGSGSRDIPGTTTQDPFFYYVKAGYMFDPFSVGKTAIIVDYAESEDITNIDDEFTTLGIFVVQNIDRLGTQIYAGFRNHQLDRPGVSVDDINVGVVGARVKF